MKKNRLLKKITLSVIMWFFGLVTVFPLIWMISSSFKIEADIFSFPIEWIPSNGTLKNYIEVWSGKFNFLKLYWNSIGVTLTTVCLATIINTIAGYGFARLNFKGRNFLFLLYISTLMVPTQVTMIPNYLVFNAVGILDSHAALILPGIFRVFCVFLMRQYFMQIPFDYSEAARIDGAGEFSIFIRLILPMAKPAVITTIILVFTWMWNDYESPLIYLTNSDLFTVPLGLSYFKDELGIQYGPLMAASASSIIVLIIVFLICQKQFIEGLTSGGIKG